VNLDDSPPDITDFSEFIMPNPMSRCDQCHVSMATAALPAGTRAPVERTYKVCNPITPSWAGGEQWCDATSSTSAGMPKYPNATTPLVISTPPMKAVCTSCHDDAATDAHADSFTTAPMTAGAVEQCASCHGTGAALDATLVHRPVFPGGTFTPFVP
jgi:hypothetical protein